MSEIPVIRARAINNAQDFEALISEIDVSILHLYRTCTSENEVLEWVRQLLLDQSWGPETGEMLRYSYGPDRLNYLKRIVAEDF